MYVTDNQDSSPEFPPAIPPFSMKAEADAFEPVKPQVPWSPAGMRRHFEIITPVCRFFRRRRMRTFLRLFQPDAQTRILDVGGLPRLWSEVPVRAPITIANLKPLPPYEACFLKANQTFVIGDGTRLASADRSYEIVFSNSVIEHLGTWDRQVAFARECRRVGRGYWIQTPAWEFPVEPHLVTLFLHWLPKRLQRRLVRRFSLWGWLARPKPDAVDAFLAEVRLLKLKEIRSLFPDGQILVERVLGLPKSYTAFKLPA